MERRYKRRKREKRHRGERGEKERESGGIALEIEESGGMAVALRAIRQILYIAPESSFVFAACWLLLFTPEQ